MATERPADGDRKQGPASNPVLERFDALTGEWLVEGVHTQLKDTVLRGRVRFEWLDGGHFLVQHLEMDHPDFPNSIGIIGLNDSGDDCSMHYFDSRGVSRVYQMNVGDGVWTVWRDAPGFSQRFRGTFSDDGATITAFWDLSRDDETWDRDIDLSYSKVG